MLIAAVAVAALALQRADGVRLAAAQEGAEPVLRVSLPGHSVATPDIEILFPEHVTARRRGSSDQEHLYLATSATTAPSWRRNGSSLEYDTELPHGIHMVARATLMDDGILFHYEMTNRSADDYDMIYAVTDPRMKSVFHDEKLERTYVHRANGFELLASQRPVRLPARYLASYTWPVPKQLVDRRDDGITYYNSPAKVDEPLLATVSSDRKWVVASFTREVGNVWSNPELTCQHVDPQKPLLAHGRAVLEVKVLILRGSLADAQAAFLRERNALP